MSTATYHYGMFSRAGDSRIHTIVKRAVKKELNEDEVIDLLYKLGKNPKYREATDTVVRDTVLRYAVDRREVPEEQKTQRR